jgi:hypothetical protein
MNPLNSKDSLNDIKKLGSCSTENVLYLRYKDQLVNAVLVNKRCLL